MKRSAPLKRTAIKPLSGILRTASLAPAKPTLAAKPKMRKCEVCKHPFAKQRMGQVVCGPYCAVIAGRQETAKAERKKDKARKEAIKSRSDWMREAQVAFNAFIRARDRLAGHLCISSNKPLDWSGNAVDAGHYRSVGSAPHLRFNEKNCHAQSKHDNRYLAGNAVDYRIGLIARIGLEAVEALEASQTLRKWTIDDLKAIKATYKAKLRSIKNAE